MGARSDFDVVVDIAVIGGGTAGAAAAWYFARLGRRVALVEARTFDEAGARWVNGIPPWMFREADFALSEPPERREQADRFHALTPSGAIGVTLEGNPLLTVDMRLVVQRLQNLARDAGATMLEGRRLEGVELEGDRPRAVRLVSESDGTDLTLRAKLFVDATGLRGALLRRIPALAAQCPPVPARDICAAAQEVAAVADRKGAAAFCARHGAAPNTVLSWVGPIGGFSLVQAQVSADLREVELLTGVTVDRQHPTPQELLRTFRAEHPWVGETTFGGGGHIPLRRPYARFAWPGLALIGNAACHVFPAHASGIGTGLIAARLLAEETTRVDPADPGSLEATWAWQAAFQRGHGAVHHAWDVFRMVSQELGPEDIERLFGSGLSTPGMVRAALDQRMPPLDAKDALAMARGALRALPVARKLAPRLARMPLVHAWCRLYPRRPDVRALRIWARTLASLLGVAADPV